MASESQLRHVLFNPDIDARSPTASQSIRVSAISAEEPDSGGGRASSRGSIVSDYSDDRVDDMLNRLDKLLEIASAATSTRETIMAKARKSLRRRSTYVSRMERACECGNLLLDDSVFCRKCGKEWKQDDFSDSDDEGVGRMRADSTYITSMLEAMTERMQSGHDFSAEDAEPRCRGCTEDADDPTRRGAFVGRQRTNTEGSEWVDEGRSSRLASTRLSTVASYREHGSRSTLTTPRRSTERSAKGGSLKAPSGSLRASVRPAASPGSSKEAKAAGMRASGSRARPSSQPLAAATDKVTAEVEALSKRTEQPSRSPLRKEPWDLQTGVRDLPARVRRTLQETDRDLSMQVRTTRPELAEERRKAARQETPEARRKTTRPEPRPESPEGRRKTQQEPEERRKSPRAESPEEKERRPAKQLQELQDELARTRRAAAQAEAQASRIMQQLENSRTEALTLARDLQQARAVARQNLESWNTELRNVTLAQERELEAVQESQRLLELLEQRNSEPQQRHQLSSQGPARSTGPASYELTTPTSFPAKSRAWACGQEAPGTAGMLSPDGSRAQIGPLIKDTSQNNIQASTSLQLENTRLQMRNAELEQRLRNLTAAFLRYASMAPPEVQQRLLQS